jgi:hypothetical protein
MPRGDIQTKFRELAEASRSFFRKENLDDGRTYISPELSNKISIFEMLAVLKGIKPAAAQMLVLGKGSELKKVVGGMEEMKRIYGLHYALSSEKYLVDSNRDFSAVVPADSQEGHLILGYSLSQDLAKRGPEYFIKKQQDPVYSRKFGEIMGYPKCCLDFGDSVSGNVGIEEKIKKSLVWSQIYIRSFRNSTTISPLLNIFTISLVPHIPCHLDCRESKRYALRLLEAIREENPAYLKALEFFMLKLNVLFWFYTERMLLLGSKKENVMHYDDFHPISYSDKRFHHPDQEFAKKFQRAASLIERGDRLVMGTEKFDIFKGDVLVGSVPKKRPFECILF